MAATTEQAWTIMVYLSGDNNLSPEMVRAINDIETLATPAGVQITIQYDALSPCFPTCRYVLPSRAPREKAPAGIPFQKGFVETVRNRNDELVEDAGNPKTLRDFITWSLRRQQTSPSRFRMLILSGHGSGAVGDFLRDDSQSTSQRRQLRQPGSLTIRGLTSALREAQEKSGLDPVVHVLGMDSCLMSTLEVAGELRNVVPYVVASEGFVPNAGWPYARLLAGLTHHFTKQPDDLIGPDGPRAMARCLVDDCADFYDEFVAAGISFDIAACETRKTLEIQRAVKALTKRLGGVSEQEVQKAVLLAHWRSQSFKFEQYSDLWDFCNELMYFAPNMKRECEGVKKAIEGRKPNGGESGAVIHQRFVGVDFQHAHGLSIYFPWSAPAYYDDDYLNEYSNLRLPKRAGWFTFLKHYLKRTQREVRTVTGGRQAKFPKTSRQKHFRQPLASARNKYASEYNRYASEYNRYMRERMGGRLPWSMKNPPQQVRLQARSLRDDSTQTPSASIQDPQTIISQALIKQAAATRRNGSGNGALGSPSSRAVTMPGRMRRRQQLANVRVKPASTGAGTAHGRPGPGRR